MQRRFINPDDGNEFHSANLLQMVKSGSVKDALRYLDEYTYPSSELNECLIPATVLGLNSVVRSLIAHGADVRHKEDGDFGLTPLHYAVKYGHLSTAEILLENGAETMASPGRNNSPAYYAIRRDSLEMLMLLCRFGLDVNWAEPTDDPLIVDAVLDRSTDILNYLLANGADPNIRSCHGHSPLFLSVSGRYEAAVSALLQYGANANEITNDGSSLFELASRRQNQTIAELIREHIKSSDGN